MFGFSSGSSNSGYESSRSSDGPPSNVFSHETLRTIIDQATNSGRLSQSDADAIRKSSNNAIPRSSGRRSHSHSNHHSEKSSRGCDCCRPGYETPPSSSHGQIGTSRVDENGDHILEWDQEGAPDLRLHCPPSPPPERESMGSRRKSSGGRKQSSGSVSSGSSSGSSRSHSDYGRNHRISTNAEGDEEVEWAGESGDLRIRAHCPDSPPLAPRRTSSSMSSGSSGFSSGKRTNSSKSSKDFRRSNSGHQQLGF